MSEPARSLAPAVTFEGLEVLAPATRYILQGRSEARRAAANAWGAPLPEQACRAVADSQRAALWLGPDEHLLIDGSADSHQTGAALSAALQGVPHSLVDISHRQIALRLRGAHATDLLATGCPLDLDLAAFPLDTCTRTVFAKTEIVLWRRGATEFHIEIGRSFADYLTRWLQQAALDFT